MAAASKRFWPRKLTDWFAFLFIQSAIHIVGAYEIFVILPYIDGDRSKTFWIHVVFGLYLYINTMSALFMVMKIDTTTSRNGVIMPSILKAGWRYCSACEANAPPRSYHCWCCDICILRRDHHCVFTGNCVGFSNHRYFLTLMWFVSVGAIYATYLNVDYTLETLDGFSLKTLFTMVLPLFSWILGITETYTFLVAFVSALCLFGFLLAAGLFMYHFLNMASGQTTFEKAQHITDWDSGFADNLRQVLGERWYLTWIGVWIPSPLSGDGITYTSRKVYENIKDM